MAYNPIFDGPEKAPTNGKNGTNVVQTPTPPVNPSYGNQGDLGLNPPNGTTTQPTTNTTTSSELQGVTLPSNEELNKVKANTTDANVDKMAVQNERGQVEVENQTQQNTQFAPNTQYANGLAEGDVNKTQVAQDRGNAEVAQAQNVFAQSSTPQGTQTKPVEYNTAPVQQGDSSYTPQQPLTYADFRDAMYGPEAEREKRANRQAKIQAVGDALRHIGNLATTIGSEKMGRAIPQQFKTSPAQQTLAEYKAERKERDAMGYQQLLQHQKQKQQEIQNELAQREAQRKADMDNWNMNFKVHQQKQKENQDEFNNKMALDKRGMEKEMQEFNIKIGNDKNDRENKKLLADIKHMNNQDAVAFGNLNMRQQEHFARVAGIGGYKGDGKNESGAKKMQSLYGVLNHKGKTDLTDEQISSIYNFANKKGWLNGTDATAFKNLVTTSQDGNMSKHAMISAITAALADDKNEGGKVYLANYLIENWDFEPTTAVGLKHYTTQKTNMARKANEKKFNVNTM